MSGTSRDWGKLTATTIAAAALLALVTGARSGCSPVPMTCPCTAEERETGALCGRDGETYESFCDLKCATGGPACTSAASCPELLLEGACSDKCFVMPGAPVELDGQTPAFLCRDLNPGAPTFGEAVSDLVLAEQVWIAYFGSCT